MRYGGHYFESDCRVKIDLDVVRAMFKLDGYATDKMSDYELCKLVIDFIKIRGLSIELSDSSLSEE